MRFVWGLLVSSLLVTGLSACASSDDEWSGERTPSREAVDDVSEAKSEPEAAADDVPDAGPAAATDDVPEAETQPAAAARANDKEAECRDPWILDYDAEDSAGNRGEQVVFVLELNESADNDGEDGGSVKCKVSLDEIDWTSITAVEDFFTAIVEEMPQRVITENVSNVVKIDPVIKKDNEYEHYNKEGELYEYFDSRYWDYGPLGIHEALHCTQPPDTTVWEQYYCGDFFNDDDPAVPHQTLQQTSGRADNIAGGYFLSDEVATFQPNAALLPSHDWQGFYQDQHLMTFGVCDAVDEEATVFFFDPNFIDEKYEYHKVWSEGSAMTQRSLPAPRFRFPYKAEDAVQQPQLIGIKIVDVATKQAVGAALIEVFVTQVKTTAGKPTTEGGKATEDLYGCKFNLKITRTYEKQSLPQRWFKSEIRKHEASNLEGASGSAGTLSKSHIDLTLARDHGARLEIKCFPFRYWQPWYLQIELNRRSDRTWLFPATISVATNTKAENYNWYPNWLYSEELDEPNSKELGEPFVPGHPPPGTWDSPGLKMESGEWGYHRLDFENPIEEILITVSKQNGDLYSRHYYWIQSDKNWDSSNEKGDCKFKINGLKMLFVDIEKIEAWIDADTTWTYGQKYKDGPKFWIEFFDN
jgi:hypothetical protein